jgi:hypothetical protein
MASIASPPSARAHRTCRTGREGSAPSQPGVAPWSGWCHLCGVRLEPGDPRVAAGPARRLRAPAGPPRSPTESQVGEPRRHQTDVPGAAGRTGQAAWLAHGVARVPGRGPGPGGRAGGAGRHAARPQHPGRADDLSTVASHRSMGLLALPAALSGLCHPRATTTANRVLRTCRCCLDQLIQGGRDGSVPASHHVLIAQRGSRGRVAQELGPSLRWATATTTRATRTSSQ